MKRFKLGDKTKNIWSGDLVSECEFICYLEDGHKMLFYDVTYKCFRRVFSELSDSGEYIMNGWNCSDRMSELL